MTVKESKAELIKEKVKELSNSRDLYAWRVSIYPEVESVLKYIFDEMESEVKVGKRYRKKYRDHVRVIVLDLFVANQTDPTMYLTYSRNSNDYKPGTKYHRMFLSYEISNKIINFLIKNAYIDDIKGYYRKDRPFDSKKPRMRATEKLIRLLENENEIETGMLKWDENEPTLILRDDEKNEIKDYPETDNIIQIRGNLKVINRNLQKHAILLYVTDAELSRINERLNRDPQRSPIDFTQKRLRRIFNDGSFKRGGRFYGGWWQNIPKEYRKDIMLNDKHVGESDYPGLHINMLYAIEKFTKPEGDVYALDGYPKNKEFRKFMKIMLQAMLNASSKDEARKALHKAVHYTKELELPNEISSTRRGDIDPLMDAFEQKHNRIKHYFCTGKGIDLQYLDSQLAERVLLNFSKMGYPILPMHDSFIIHRDLQNELEDSMEMAFFDMFGIKIKPDVTYSFWDEQQKEQEIKVPEPCDLSAKELFEALSEHGEHGTYFRFLKQHRKYK